MTLEDHVGDIVRKAREAAKLPVETAASAAGLTAADYAALEQSGRTEPKPDWTGLASRLGLSAPKLEAIARGWAPPACDLSLWRELRVVTTTREGVTVNCFLIWDEVSREAALFDTGWDAAPVFQLLDEHQLQLRHLFLTHTHDDHVAALGAIRERFPKLFLHTNSRSAPPQHRNRANDFIHLGSLRISNRALPGHAEDGVIYLVGTWPEDAPHVAVVGDTLFAGSIASGLVSWEELRRGIREQMLTLPPETLLCPGHGPLTTVAAERAHNPFF